MIVLNLNDTTYKVEDYESAIDIIVEYCEEHNLVIIDNFDYTEYTDFLIMRDNPYDAYFEWATIS